MGGFVNLAALLAAGQPFDIAACEPRQFRHLGPVAIEILWQLLNLWLLLGQSEQYVRFLGF